MCFISILLSQEKANSHQLGIQLREQEAEAERQVAELEQTISDLESQLQQQQVCCRSI